MERLADLNLNPPGAVHRGIGIFVTVKGVNFTMGQWSTFSATPGRMGGIFTGETERARGRYLNR